MLTDIRLQNFRSYKDESFELGSGVNIIIGPNASGKTNLLEAILVLSTGRSYRAHDNDLIHRGKKWARVDAHTPSGGRTLKLENRSDTKTTAKSFSIDDKIHRRLKLEDTLPVVLFEPNNLWLLSGEPTLRREFLDNLLTQLIPGFDEINNRYQRALKQRNSLLKRGIKTAKPQLFAWDIRLSELGGQIAAHRMELIKQMSKNISSIYSELAKEKAKLKLEYKTSIGSLDYGSQLLKQLERRSETDAVRGFTSVGPHRDDLAITLNREPMNITASRGETRTLLLALKIIELKLLEKVRGLAPLLLLDDVFSELDGRRRSAVTDFFKKYQTFITTTDADVVAQHFTRRSNVIPVSHQAGS
jgi:DNA replication and repair protein RecF